VNQLDAQGADGALYAVAAVDPGTVGQVAKIGVVVPQPGTLVVPEVDLREYGLQDGGTVALDAGRGARDFTVVATGLAQPMMIAASDAAPGANTVWVRAADDADDRQLRELQREVAAVAEAAAPGVEVTGTVALRATMNSIIDTLLMVVGGLLSIAVLIALIGVGNTMALSVIERRRESALLRVVGLARAGLRTLLVWESALVAAVAAVLGVGLGILFGIAGTASLFGIGNVALDAMPWLPLAGIVLAAGAAGIVAAVVPARQAMKAAPVEALG
jgi:putative ABC transport system permease protein